MANEIWRHLEQRRSDVERHRENATRPARAFGEYRATGSGVYVNDQVFAFECTFTERPIFTYGASLDDGVDLPDDPPRCTAGVYDWRQTANGYYTGAFLWFNVDTFDLVDSDFAVIFGLSFEGLASKDFINSTGFPVYKLDVSWGTQL